MGQYWSVTQDGADFPERTTAQRNALINPPTGLTFFNSDTGSLETNVGTPGSPVWSASNIKNVVIVTLLSDFPTPVAGVITLQDNMTYIITTTVVLGTNRIEAGVSNTIYSFDKSTGVLVYTGASAMISTTNKDVSIVNTTLVASSVGGSVFNLQGTSANNIEIRDCIFANCKSIGVINGFGVCVFQKNFVTLCDQGIQFGSTASEDLIFIDNYFKSLNNTVGCKFIDIIAGGSYSDIIISRNHFDTQSNETALTVGAITIAEYGKVLDNTFHSTGTSTSGVSYSSAGWLFQGNSDILNTVANGQIRFVDNATTTTVNNTAVAINGTFTLKSGANKFDSPSNGILRYTDKEPATIRLMANLCAFGASSYTAECTIWKNGAQQNESKMGFTIYTAREFITIMFLDNNAVQNDQYEVRIRKTTAGNVTTTIIDLQLSGFKL